MTTRHDAALHQLAEDFAAARNAYEAAIESVRPHQARMLGIYQEMRGHGTPLAHTLANEREPQLANRTTIEPTPAQFKDARDAARQRFEELTPPQEAE